MREGLRSRHFEKTCRVVTACLAMALSSQARAEAPLGSVKKVVNGKVAVQVDNGWVVYQGVNFQPTMNLYDADNNTTLPMKTLGYGPNGVGLLFNTNGIVFAPCPVAPLPGRCATNHLGQSGIGIAFGQATFGGAGGSGGGWISDTTVTVRLTNEDQLAGSISGLAIDPVNGAYAVGWEISTPSFNAHALLWRLDSANQTYLPLSKLDLGTLGGRTSQAFGISKNARYIVGIANNAANKGRAVYALNTDTAWTDIATGFPTEVLKSRALAASDTGFITGSATVQRLVAGKKKNVDIGFVYNTANGSAKFFEAAGFHVKPLRVLDDGRVVGNLESAGAGTIKPNHPFLFDGTNLVDFGTMIIAGQPAFGCRVNRPNNLGELAGSCVPNSTTPYGPAGKAFYLNAVASFPVFVDVNAGIHASSDSNTTGLGAYNLGSVSAIDDQHEITVMGYRILNGAPVSAAFLATKAAYNP